MTHDEQRERRKNIADDLAGGMTVSELAIKYQVSPQTIYLAAHEYNVRWPRDIKPSNYQVIGLFQRGKSVPQVAQELRISRQAVDQTIQAARAAGVPLPRRFHRSRWLQAMIAVADSEDGEEGKS